MPVMDESPSSNLTDLEKELVPLSLVGSSSRYVPLLSNLTVLFCVFTVIFFLSEFLYSLIGFITGMSSDLARDGFFRVFAEELMYL